MTTQRIRSYRRGDAPVNLNGEQRRKSGVRLRPGESRQPAMASCSMAVSESPSDAMRGTRSRPTPPVSISTDRSTRAASPPRSVDPTSGTQPGTRSPAGAPPDPGISRFVISLLTGHTQLPKPNASAIRTAGSGWTKPRAARNTNSAASAVSREAVRAAPYHHQNGRVRYRRTGRARRTPATRPTGRRHRTC